MKHRRRHRQITPKLARILLLLLKLPRGSEIVVPSSH